MISYGKKKSKIGKTIIPFSRVDRELREKSKKVNRGLR